MPYKKLKIKLYDKIKMINHVMVLVQKKEDKKTWKYVHSIIVQILHQEQYHKNILFQII